MTKTKTSHLSSGSQTQHFTLDRRDLSTLSKNRGRLVVDAKLLKDHFLRQQRGGNIAEFLGARMQRDMGSEVFSRALRDMLYLCSNKVLKLLVKEHCKQPQKSVKMYSKEKCKRSF